MDRTSVGTAVLGAGPAGLTAAYVLALREQEGAVFEADAVVGGLAKTVEFGGYRFDLGGHRFFTKLAPIERLWRSMLGEDFLTRPRLSRIYYQGRYLRYPLVARDVVGRLGLLESTLCALSYFWTKIKRPPEPVTFEDWVTSRFGRRLYHSFFQSYTEKVWGIPGTEIQSAWAAQRIKNFSFWRAMLGLVGLRRNVTTLIEEFQYPRLGPGQMWDAFRCFVEERGIPVNLSQRCVSIRHAQGCVESIVLRSNGRDTEVPVDAVLSSIPLSELVLSLDPPPPPEVVEAARGLRYRDFVLVALITSDPEPFPDNWIYLHDPETKAGRVQNFGAWSESMVVPDTTCLGVEYFCFEGDEIWELRDDEAVELAAAELARIGLIDPAHVLGGVKVRVPKAYPMYDLRYGDRVEVLRRYLADFENLQTFGRNGLHRYNNQDHSMWTAILATLNLLDGTSYDVWSVNTEAAYLEEGEIVDELLDVELVA
ncbi:MAG TPA: NAD(P)/FAD-dependent oxidoreductase [Gaiellaceae bacterium]|jgi:protoporphyrinogen oxidase|nr:NAD(P)/FAD-dependent oxidoreductase [Gaiellaceae bacterium]